MSLFQLNARSLFLKSSQDYCSNISQTLGQLATMHQQTRKRNSLCSQ